MDRHAAIVVKSLTFLTSLFPADDESRKELREVFAETIELCRGLLVESKEEEAKAQSATTTKFITEAPPEICPCAAKDCVEEYEEDLSQWKKDQLLKEAIIARDQLKAVMDEVEAHLKVLQPTDKVEIKGGNVIVHSA